MSAEDPAIASGSYPPMDIRIGPVIGNAVCKTVAADTGVVCISAIPHMGAHRGRSRSGTPSPTTRPAKDGRC